VPPTELRSESKKHPIHMTKPNSPMKIALLGATGNVGSVILVEAERRGHAITAIARRPESVPPRPGVTPLRGDVTDEGALGRLLPGHDAVISSVKFVRIDAALLVRAVKAAGVPRLLVVGGAGSLEVAPGVALVDTPQFPMAYKREALAGQAFLSGLRTEQSLPWTFLSPAALLMPGERTGRFRLGGDQLLVDAQGQSEISLEDYAMALIDELERPRHSFRRFTVGY